MIMNQATVGPRGCIREIAHAHDRANLQSLLAKGAAGPSPLAAGVRGGRGNRGIRRGPVRLGAERLKPRSVGACRAWPGLGAGAETKGEGQS